MMHIDRCVCFQKLFAELSDVARRTQSKSLEELQTHVTFGANCKLCHPYVRRMLDTGETVFGQGLESGVGGPE